MKANEAKAVLEFMRSPMYVAELETEPTNVVCFYSPFDRPQKVTIKVKNVSNADRMVRAATTSAEMFEIENGNMFLKTGFRLPMILKLKPNHGSIGQTEYLVLSHVTADATAGSAYNQGYFDRCFNVGRMGIIIEFDKN